MHPLRHGPLRKTVVTPAEHANLAIAPRLFADPIHDVMSVLRFVLVWRDFFGTQRLAACVGDHTCVAVRGAQKRLAIIPGGRINREGQRGGLWRRDALLANYNRGNCRAGRRLNQDVVADVVAAIGFFRLERLGERRSVVINKIQFVFSNQRNGILERNGISLLLWIKRSLKIVSRERHIECPSTRSSIRGDVA